MQPLYTTLKVNNEIEFCELYNEEGKNLVEKVLLQNRISYYIRWSKKKLFSRHNSLCTICINETALEQAEEIIKKEFEDSDLPISFPKRHITNEYL